MTSPSISPIRPICLTLLIGAVLVFSGCRITYRVGMGPRTPTTFGKIELYSTENVPFEYEEIEYISILVEGWIETWFAPPTQEQVLEAFRQEVARTGADAVINLRIETRYYSDWLVFPGGRNTHISGTAVRKLRP